MVAYVPKKGDVVWLAFDPQKGKEIQKTRPALVISPEKYNAKTGMALFMPITSQIKGYPFEVTIIIDDVNSAILSDQIRSLDWRARKARFITSISNEIVEEALGKLSTLL